MSAISNAVRNKAVIGQLSKANAASTSSEILKKVFVEVPEPFAGIAEKELRILASYDQSINAAKEKQVQVLKRLEQLSIKLTAVSKMK